MEIERYQNLHTIIMLRDVIRKWWRSELRFADKSGNVLEWQKGDVAPPVNDLCRSSLFSTEGLRRCEQSVRVLHERFMSSRQLRNAVTHDCHLGLHLAAVPLYVRDEYEGFLFVEGFARPALGEGDLGKLIDLLEVAVQEVTSHEAALLKKEELHPASRYKFENIVGHSAAMAEIFRLLEKVANSDSTVLINGESGTGKELVARAIHYNGPRKDKPFVVQNCSAFNDNLLESALFGHTKGSFTGALRDTKGLFEKADGGSFFLDEVGDMSPALQVKLLRVIQEGAFLPVGGTTPKEVDVRVIAATNKDLAQLVKQGEFREDLYYRINVIRVQMPPLRERKEDLPLLIEHFLNKHRRPGQRTRGLSPEALAVLSDYTWPGNIRELENEIERLLVLGSDLDSLPADLISNRIRDVARPPAGAFPEARSTGNLNEAVETLEREMIQQGLVRTRNNKSRLARELGISRSNLILKIAKYRLEKADASNGGQEANP